MNKLNPLVFVLKIVFLASVFISISCRADAVRLEQIPVPPGAEKGIKYPEFNTEIDLATNFVVADLKKKTGKVDTVFYTLKEPADWKNLVEFYDAELKKMDFTRASDTTPPNEKTKTIYYSRSGFPSNQNIVVVLIEIKSQPNPPATDQSAAAKYQFLMLGS